MGKDCGRGNAKALAVYHVAEGGGDRKLLQTYRLAYLFRNAANPGGIARGNSSLYYASNIPQKRVT